MIKVFGGRVLRHLLGFFILVAATATSAHALTLTSGPVFTTTPNAPLAGLVEFGTDVPSRVRVAVTNAMESWQRDFFEYDTAHSVPLLGFKPGRTNLVNITALDRFGNEIAATQSLVFVTGPVPSDFPLATLLKSDPDKME